MITFSNLGKYGRLGNQLFQIASTIGISLDNRQNYVFPEWICSYTNKNYSIFFSRPLPTKNLLGCHRMYEKSFEYNRVVIEDSYENIDLFGYFQSEKYFEKYREKILYYFEPKKKIIDFIDINYGKKLENSCSIHVRRGDYISLQHIHPLISIDYYYKSIDYLYGNYIEEINFLIFSDDISWCKENINLPKATFVEIGDDILELYLMSKCKNNIIANSSFSWWGAWLNKNEDKKIVAPENWFNKNVRNNTQDLYCKNWFVI